MKNLSALIFITAALLVSPNTSFAYIEGKLESEGAISPALAKAEADGMNIADAVAEMLEANLDMAAKIISTATREYPDFAGEIVSIAIKSGVLLRTVVISAIKGAPDRSGQIISAAIGIMPDHEDVIAQYALDAGASRKVVARSIAVARIVVAQTARTAGGGESETNHAGIPSGGRGGVVSPH